MKGLFVFKPFASDFQAHRFSRIKKHLVKVKFNPRYLCYCDVNIILSTITRSFRQENGVFLQENSYPKLMCVIKIVEQCSNINDYLNFQLVLSSIAGCTIMFYF